MVLTTNMMRMKTFRTLPYFAILLISTIIIFSLLFTDGYNNNHTPASTQITTATISPDFAKVIINTIQALQSKNIDTTIQAAEIENLPLRDISAIPTTCITIPLDTFLTYRNPSYGIEIQYPYDWIVEGTNYKAGDVGVQIASFYLPNISDGLPFIRVGVDDLTKEFPQRLSSISILDYLKESLKGKNATGFPGFKLIEYNTNTNSTIAGNPAYTIIWTYNHPTYGIRKSIEFGAVIGNKGYFIDYTADAAKFSNYLQIVQKMINSFRVLMINSESQQMQI